MKLDTKYQKETDDMTALDVEWKEFTIGHKKEKERKKEIKGLAKKRRNERRENADVKRKGAM